MNNLLIFISYYILILFSILGYGLLFLTVLKIKTRQINFGYVGLFGLYVLIVYAFLSNLIIAHSETHNITIIFLGIIMYIILTIKKYYILKKEIIFTVLIFVLLFVSLLQFKNHDDFPYYHFPYTYYLTQQSLYIGVGQFNHGFRTPSSIFYLNSLFYLPFAKFYLLNFSSVFILGFSNIILLKKIHYYFKFIKINKEKINFINYLSLFTLIFINSFFYRLSEYGTDRAAMILIFLFIIELLSIIYIKQKKGPDLIYIYLLGAIIVSLKAFYILYSLFIIPLFIFVLKKNNSYYKTFNYLFFNKYFFIFFILLFLLLTTNFLNTGCILYPLSFTCLDSLSWAIPLPEVQQMNNWYELWSKGGAAPNFRVDNPEQYIKNFHWVNNWIDIYFFNKVSDYILGLLTLIVIVLIFFKDSFFNKKIIKIDRHVFLVYFLIFFLGVEWFYNHPALRYGGYHILALLFFIPISIKISSSSITNKKFTKFVFILIIITTSIFISRNLNRIYNEVENYNYKPIKNTFYEVGNHYFRVQETMDNLINQHNDCHDLIKECKKNDKIIKKYGKIIFVNK